MKITVYTTNTCEFSKKEKEFLAANNLPFEEKNLESNREFLTEMLAVSNNFAGTPVTRIEKEDGQIIVLKGFTEEEFKTALGISPAPAAATVAPESVPATVAEPVVAQPVNPTPEVVSPVAPAPVVETPAVTAPVAEVPPAPVQTTPEDAQLNSILSDLQSKAAEPVVQSPTPVAAEPVAPAPVTSAPAAPPTGLPNIPEPNFS